MPIELRKVRPSFEKRARAADIAFLLREIAKRMNERLSVIKIMPSRILDAGCGYGDDLKVFAENFPDARIVGIDTSLAMLDHVRRDWHDRDGMIDCVCGDVGSLPFGQAVFDMVWSNLVIHWHEDAASVFREWISVLRQDGLLMFSCLGQGTWSGLRNVCKDMDKYSHILEFGSMRDIGDSLIDAGFTAPVLEREWVTVTYSTVEKMLADVRAFGGHLPGGRPVDPRNMDDYKKLVNCLNTKRNEDGWLSLEFEIIYAHAFNGKVAMREERVIEIFR